MDHLTHTLPISAPFPAEFTRDEAAVAAALGGYLLSASGWRRVFAAAAESAEPEVDLPGRELSALSAAVFARLIGERSGGKPPVIALAIDTRPTGPQIAAVAARVFLSSGIDVRYLGIAPAPEIMAYSRLQKLSGFLLLTASHNPIGYNGFKFGFADGGVIGSADSQRLVTAFQELGADPAASRDVVRKLCAVEEGALSRLNEQSPQWKSDSLESYRLFTREVVTGFTDAAKQDEILNRLRDGAVRRGIGVVVDYNGSARTASIDKELLEALGIKYRAINDKPGEIRHMIVPEGEALEPCRLLLESAAREDGGFLFGYVPDNDGDRGNIVYMDQQAKIIPSQQLFALSCLSELSYLSYVPKISGDATTSNPQKVAVAVNGPTSLRIDAIAKSFDAFVFRSEVGEANVVNLARDSRKSGFTVRILGEGSNGGNITHPSAVRDPINTLTALLKLLLLTSTDAVPGLFRIWCDRAHYPCTSQLEANLGISEILESMPKYTTTDAYDERAAVALSTTDQVRLKQRYEELFVQEWEEKRSELEGRFGITSWEEVNYEGINEVHGFGPTYRSGKQRGGLKIVFKDGKGKMIAFLWMRGSATEPVFRVLADVRGDNPDDERRLLDWHVSMVKRADELACADR